MDILKKRVILIISPQDWGKMRLSKHHYALELAAQGNTVYFLNPPDQKAERRWNSVAITPSTEQKGLFLIDHRLFFPFVLKFKAKPIFKFLMQFHLKKILDTIPEPVDIVWSFDLGNLYPLYYFPEQMVKIFHPVDEPRDAEAIAAAKGADHIFSVTNEILHKYGEYKIPKQFIHHGVQPSFLSQYIVKDYTLVKDKLKIGYSGNMLRSDMDRTTLLQIVAEHPELEFHFYGSYSIGQNNIGGNEDQELLNFIAALKNFHHVFLHGVLEGDQLCRAFAEMDLFLVCYDIEKDQSKGTNYHKLMEYLATGRTVVSNNITTYADQPDLITMSSGRSDNKGLASLFSEVVANIAVYNAPEKMQIRHAFASGNTYAEQIKRISICIASTWQAKRSMDPSKTQRT